MQEVERELCWGVLDLFFLADWFDITNHCIHNISFLDFVGDNFVAFCIGCHIIAVAVEYAVLLDLPFQLSVIFNEMLAQIKEISTCCWVNSDSVRMIQDFQELRVMPDVFDAVDAFQTVEEMVACIFGVSDNQENKLNSFKITTLNQIRNQ